MTTYTGPILTETDDEYAARVIVGSRHGRPAHCPGCARLSLARAYAFAALGIAGVVLAHIALGW